MAVTIYKYRKPEITVTLTSGGTLAANTTYYIGGLFHKNRVYNSVFSCFSNIVSFTTDTINKSISVYWKVTVPIQGFENGGTNRIRVKATNHCLKAGDTLIIESGTYAGTYTVTTWENYNSFLITGTYSVDETSTFRVETAHNAMTGIMFYMHTVAPFSGDPSLGTWVGTQNKFSHYAFSGGYTTNNIAFTAPFTTQMYGQPPEIQGTTYPPQQWSKVMSEGEIWIELSGTTATIAEIKQALIDSNSLGVGYITGKTFVFYGILQATQTNEIEFADMTITCYWGMMGCDTGFTKLKYTRCSFSLPESMYGSYLRSTANYSNFFFNLATPFATNVGYVYSYPIGSNNSFIVNGIGSENMDNNKTITNMTVTCNDSTGQWRLDCGKNIVLKNARINLGFLYLYYIYLNPSPTLRLIDGAYIDSASGYDISIQYNNTKTALELRNIDTSRTNNRKITYTGYAFQTFAHITSIYYYRSKTITVRDKNGTAISGATVTLLNANGDTVSYTSDTNGQITFEVLEQKSSPATTGNYFVETYYDDWTLTVSKTGYETYISKSTYAYLIETEVSLKPIVPVRQTIEGKLLLANQPSLGSSSKLLEL